MFRAKEESDEHAAGDTRGVRQLQLTTQLRNPESSAEHRLSFFH